jgi:hypothetical protein
VLRLIQVRLATPSLAKKTANLSNQFAESTNRSFQFQKRRQLLIRSHNEPLSVVAVLRQQSGSFVPENQRLRRSPSSNQLS